ncbi:MAG TPA: outer membrane beta-barrel protein [Bryobacteraceae bacterium]|jgi:hypothetical protein|nr:outer membrane beta-barrel protein [Bryobacteraceae bacterium]
MKRIAGLLALSALFAAFLEAQDQRVFIPSVGVEVGVPVTSMFTTYPITALDYPVTYTPYSFAVPSYEVGPYAVFRLTSHFGFEVGALYRPGELAFEQPANQFYEHAHFNSWQFPFLFQYRLNTRHVHPFVNVGAALRHFSGVQTTFYGPGVGTGVSLNSFPDTQNGSDFLRNWSSWGGVAGAGVEFRKGRLEFRPQVRYTRWWNQSFDGVGLTNNLNEVSVILGIGF